MANKDPGLVFGQVPAATDWDAYFATKVDGTGGTLNSGTLIESVVTVNNAGTIPRALEDRFGENYNVLDWGAKGDLATCTGTFTWNAGGTLTIASGSLTTGGALNLTSADVGKLFNVPAGGTAGAVTLTTIRSVLSPTSCVTDPPVVPFVAGVSKLDDTQTDVPAAITIKTAGSLYLIGDTCTITGGVAIRPATVTVLKTTATAVTVNNTGSLGPPGFFTGIGTTGQGRRVKVAGSIAASGTVVAASVSITSGGGYYVNPTTLSAEPIAVLPTPITSTITHGASATIVVVGSSTGMLVGNPITAATIPQGDTISAVGAGGTLTIGPSATTGVSTAGETCVVTNNSQPIYVTATGTAGTNVVVASGTAGMAVGMACGGSFIAGSGSPTDPNVTTITTIAAGNTLTLHSPLGNAVTATVTAGSFNVQPLLTGLTVGLTTGITSVAMHDGGVYSVLPGATVSCASATGTGATFVIPTKTLTADYFTDDSAAQLAMFTAIRNLGATGSAVVHWPAGHIYGTVQPLNLTGLQSKNYQLHCAGEIRSFADNGIAIDMMSSNGITFRSINLTTGYGTAPQAGIAMGVTAADGTPSGGHVIRNPWILGTFRKVALYNMGSETTVVQGGQVKNFYAGSPYINPGDTINPAGTLYPAAIAVDGTNRWGISSTYAPMHYPANTAITMTLAQFDGTRALNSGTGPAWWLAGAQRPVVTKGYGATWGYATIVLNLGLADFSGGLTQPYLDIHTETSAGEDTFLLTGDASLITVAGLTYSDPAPQAGHVTFGVDVSRANVQIVNADIRTIRPFVATGVLFDEAKLANTQFSGDITTLSPTFVNTASVFKGRVINGTTINTTTDTLTVSTQLIALAAAQFQGLTTFNQGNASGSFLLHDARIIGLTNPSTLSSTILNGGTLTLTATAPSTLPGPFVLNIGTGTIAGCTVKLPDETQIQNGFVQDIEATGTVTTITWISPDSISTALLPTTVSNVAPLRIKYHNETAAPQWMVAK